MSIWEMKNKTKTYIAGDWDNDKDAVDKLHQWNDSKYWSLSFVDVHEFTQSRDTSLYCSIKRSLGQRMAISKTFILIVGEHTATVTKGKCCYCKYYTRNAYGNYCCSSGNSPFNNESYIEFECKKALEECYKIVVLYKSTSVDRSKCPEPVRWRGVHIAMKTKKYNGFNFYEDWNYQTVKDAITG